MAVTVTHTTAATGVDAGDGSISKNAWNATHTVDATTLPGYEFDYAQATSNVSVTATLEASADVIVTGNAVAYDGSAVVMVEFFTANARPDTGSAASTMYLWLFDGSSSIGRIALIVTPAASGDNKPVYAVRRITPSAATHTYSIRGSVITGTGVCAAGAGGSGNTVPMFIRITRV